MKTRQLIYKAILLLLLVSTTAIIGQNEKNHWYFGQNAYIDFTTGAPVVANGPLNTWEGCATVADSAGSLLFFTDGINVYDSTSALMPNGTGLKGDPSSTHSALVIPNPCDPDLYYIFTTAAIGNDGMYVYTVDLSMNGGLGDVVGGSERLLLIDATEKIAATFHSNGIDFWVVTTRETTGFVEIYSWLVSQTGVAPTPNIYTSTHATLTNSGGTNGATGNYPGQIKFNNVGTVLAAAQLYFDREIDFFAFDTSTGLVTNFIVAEPVQGGPYGIEFSPNDNYAYITSYFLNAVYQIDVTSLPAIPAKVQLGSVIGTRGGALQLSPNGQKIYAAQMNVQSIGAIDNVNTTAATYTNADITLAAGTQSKLGLPTFVSGTQNLSGQCLALDPFQNAVPAIASQALVNELTTSGFQGKDKEFGDFDNDGDVDILYTVISPTSNTPELHVLINTAGPGNTPSYNIPGLNLNVDFCYSHRLFDWNNDGWNDVVVYGHAAGVYVFLNNQVGGLNPAPITLLQDGVDFRYNDEALIEIGDLNNDGFPDLLISSQSIEFPGTVYFENNGFGSFTLPAPQVYTLGVGISNPFIPENNGSYPAPEIYDADCDGDLDVFISDPLFGPPFGGGRVFYHENYGGVTSNSLPNININGLTNQYGFNDDTASNSPLRCDWVITRIIDFNGDDCPMAIAYNPCNDEFFFYDQDCSCQSIILGISEVDANTQKNVVILYPNPTSDYFAIHSEGDQALKHVQIFGFNGNLLKDLKVQNKESIDISAFANGIYFVKISSEGINTMKKLIKR